MICESAFDPGTSRLPYYCTPPLTAPDVSGARAVWPQNTQKKGKSEVSSPCSVKGSPPPWSWPDKEQTGDVGREGSIVGAWAWGGRTVKV